jgi:hypothetical protein
LIAVGLLISSALRLIGVPPVDTAHAQATTLQVSRSAKNDTSPPLRSLSPLTVRPDAQRPPGRVSFAAQAALRAAPQAASPTAARLDPGRQVVPAGATSRMPAPTVGFNGINNPTPITPPDVNGAVGPNHFVQMTNVGFAIYNKSGALLYGPAATSTLFTGFGGLCEANDDGDPIVLYDRLADRWLLSQFAVTGGPPFFECIAISQSGDPLGSYNRYAFQFNIFPDYPKFGIWPDAYYLSLNFSNFGQVVGAVGQGRA